MILNSDTIDADRFLDWFESPKQDRATLGGKGASLARMAGSLGLPVPPGFTITTAAWQAFASVEASAPEALVSAISDRLNELAARLDSGVNDASKPLLVSVRSGAPVSMPGMMDTVLNVGLNDDIVVKLAERTTPRFAYQSYLRLLSTYAVVVREIPAEELEELRAEDSDVDDLEMVERWKALIEKHGLPFPSTILEQVRESVEAVWRSWNRPRAKRYRRFRGIPEDLGTAATIQAMVFGNLDEDSGTGVVFTRHPGTGEAVLYGDFMPCAQGEDVVSGSAIPEPVQVLGDRSVALWSDLEKACKTLEADTTDMCDIEFTVQHGSFFLLQSRAGQRSPAAAARIAVEMEREGLIDRSTALKRVTLGALQHLQSPSAIGLDGMDVIGAGIPASPGTGVGPAVFDSARAEALAETGVHPVLLCPTTSPQDINGMIVSVGVVTGLGGRASHAAVVARGMGKPAVCGMEDMDIDVLGRKATFASGAVIVEGDIVTVDGASGRLFAGTAEFHSPVADAWVQDLLNWCDERSTVPVLDSEAADGVRISGPDGLIAAGRPVVVDVAWEGVDSSSFLNRTCEYVFSTVDSSTAVYIVLPPDLAGIDFQPPAGRWAGVITRRADDWAARLLAARLSAAPSSELAGTPRV